MNMGLSWLRGRKYSAKRYGIQGYVGGVVSDQLDPREKLLGGPRWRLSLRLTKEFTTSKNSY